METIVGYRVKENNSSDSDSDASDEECTVWKRASRKSSNDDIEKPSIELPAPVESCITKLGNPTANPVGSSASKPKRKRNTIWSDVLEDQLIADDLGGVLLKNKPKGYGSRGHESYDYTLSYKYRCTEGDLDSHMSADELSEESETNSMTSCDSKNFYKKNFVKLDSAESAAAKKIINVLNEKKRYLIFRIVKMVGIEKAIQLLNMTEEIEENGGMMIKSQARRRTPGGVYLQLLKNDKSIEQEVRDKIFEGEMTSFEAKKFFDEKRKVMKQSGKRKKRKPKTSKGGQKAKQLEESQEMILDEQIDMASKDMEEESPLGQNTIADPIEKDDMLNAADDNVNNSAKCEDLEDGEILE